MTEIAVELMDASWHSAPRLNQDAATTESVASPLVRYHRDCGAGRCPKPLLTANVAQW